MLETNLKKNLSLYAVDEYLYVMMFLSVGTAWNNQSFGAVGLGSV